jgi:hypothetical protein
VQTRCSCNQLHLAAECTAVCTRKLQRNDCAPPVAVAISEAIRYVFITYTGTAPDCATSSSQVRSARIGLALWPAAVVPRAPAALIQDPHGWPSLSAARALPTSPLRCHPTWLTHPNNRLVRHLTTAQTAALFHAAVQLLFSELMVVSGGINLAYMKPTGGTFFTASQPSSLAVDGEKATYAQCTNSNGGPQVLVPACRPACCAVARRSVATG